MITLNAAPTAELATPPDGAASAVAAAEGAGEGAVVPFARLLGLALDAPASAEGKGKTQAAKDAQDAGEEAGVAPAQADILTRILPAIALQPTVTPQSAIACAGAQGAGDAAGAVTAPPGPSTRGKMTDAVAATQEAAPNAAPADLTAISAVAADGTGSDARAKGDTLQATLPAAAAELHMNADAASAVPITHPAAASAPAGAAPAPLRVAAPVQAPEFPREFAAQVQIAVQRGIEHASIQVHPPELGPVEVRLELGNGEARAHFAADSAATRDAITDALPKLRELLASQGLTLTGSSVGAEMPQREQTAAQRQAAVPAAGPAGSDATPEPAGAARVTVRLLDVFA